MDDLPEEILINIFHRLPVKAIGLCICVKRYWLSLIKNPNFVSSNTQINYINNPYLVFWIYNYGVDLRFDNRKLDFYNFFTLPRGDDPESYDDDGMGFPTCNGMICLTKRDGTIMLWNPTIRKLLTLPKPNLAPIDYNERRHLGFWFDSLMNDYKVVRIISSVVGHIIQPLRLEIFSLYTFSWKTISEIAPNFEIFEHSIPILNGTLHWIGYDDAQSECHSIFGYDVDEVFRKIELPEVLRTAFIFLKLAVYNENSLAVCSEHVSSYVINVWVMREYGNLDSWTKIWQLDESQLVFLRTLHDTSYPPNVIGLLNNGEVLWEVTFLLSGSSISAHQIYISNPEGSKKNKSLALLDDAASISPQSFFEFSRAVQYFEESLALLDNANAVTLNGTDVE